VTQIVVLEATFLALAFANALAYGALTARTARTAGRAGAPGLVRWLRGLAGAVLVGTGTWTLAFAP
jgi:threonine/homoserine/homoserine lactone efflux protein